MFTNDDRKLVRAVRETAALYPDVIYNDGILNQGCFYSPDQHNPYGCIMGKAFRDLIGLSLDDEMAGIELVLGDLMERNDLHWSDSVVDWARWVQTQQDQGCSWWDAVASADKTFPVVAEEFPPISGAEAAEMREEAAS